jgi:hypothetical protein
VQAELKAAKHFKNGGDTITEFRQKGGTGKPDIDVVTNNKVVSVKGGNLANLKLSRFEAELELLKSKAGTKTPCFAVPNGITIPSEVQRVIDSVGGITVITF